MGGYKYAVLLILLLQCAVGLGAKCKTSQVAESVARGCKRYVIYDPKVPLSCDVGPVTVGKQVYVCGKVKSNYKRFQIDLQTDSGDAAFHLDFRFNYLQSKKVVLGNTRVKGKWGERVTGTWYPITEGQSFCIVIIAESDGYKALFPTDNNFNRRIFENNYPYRLDKSTVRSVGVYSDFEVEHVGFTIRN